MPRLPARTASYAALLDYLSEHHGSTTAFVKHLHWTLLRHFRSSPLAFFTPIEPYVPSTAGSNAARAARNQPGDKKQLVSSAHPELVGRRADRLKNLLSILSQDDA